MRTKTTYSRFLQNVVPWKDFSKGQMIQALHHCVEYDINSFSTNDFDGTETPGKLFGIALSESGLSRDEIQLISKYGGQKNLLTTVEDILIELETDYLDLVLLKQNQLTASIHSEVEQLMSQGKLIEVGGLQLQQNFSAAFGIPLTANMLASPLENSRTLSLLPSSEEVPEEVIYMLSVTPSKSPAHLPSILEDLAPSFNCSPQQLYLVWLLQHPAHLHLELDYTDKDDLTAAMRVKDKKLDPMDWQKIKIALEGN